MVPDDAERLVHEVEAADSKTLYYRFFTPVVHLDEDEIRWLTQLDYQDRLALVAFAEDGTGVAVVRYAAGTEPATAEVAFAVKATWRRRGVATAMYELLEKAAIERGFTTFTGVYLSENRGADVLLKRLGFLVVAADSGVVEVAKRLS